MPERFGRARGAFEGGVGDIEKDVEMPDNTSDQTRIENEKLKQQRFREEFFAGVPS